MSLSRRSVLKFSALAGGGMAVSLVFSKGDEFASFLTAQGSTALADDGSGSEFGPFLRIYPDNRVEFVLDRVEMGQGTATSSVMLLCEELDYPPDEVVVLQAPADSAYNNTRFRAQMTGGSTSVAEGHEKLREAGAEARARLLKAAAAEWEVELEALEARDGVVFLKADRAQQATYGQLAARAAELSPGRTKLKEWNQHRLIGSEAPRVDRFDKSMGKAVYSIDAAPEGSLVAVLIRPPFPGAKLAGYDEQSVQGMRGVQKVVTLPGSAVAVIAEKYWQASGAARALESTVRWDADGAFQMSSAQLLQLFHKEAEQEGDSVRSDGNFAKTYRAAEKKILADYELPYLAHATLEPQSATCLYKEESAGGSDEIVAEIWSCSQVPDSATAFVADALGISRDKVVLHNHVLGGGFGRRLRPDYIIEAVEVARAAKMSVPIMVQWSREDDMRNDDYRPMAVCRMMGSVDDQGKLSSFFYRCAGQSIMRQFAPGFALNLMPTWFPSGLTRFLGESMGSFMAGMVAVEGAKDTAYQCPNLEVEFREIELPVRVGFWRSVGHSINGFVIESFIDELAHLAQTDPYRFRRKHLSDDDRRAGVLDRVAQLSGWGQTLPEGVHAGIAVHKSFESYVAQVAHVSVKGGSVKVHRVFCVVDCGRVINPLIVREQMESSIIYGLCAVLTGEITFESGRVVQSNFHDYPLLRMSECPEMTVEIVSSTEDPTGVGEPGLPPLGAAVCNAVFKATGKRVRSLPLSRSLV
jgi:isoquinoline 1-oxidoreductase beta subunit